MVRPAKKWSHADTVCAHPLLSNSQYPAGATSPLPLKYLKSTVLNKLSKSDHSPSTQALPLPMSSGDRNVLQRKASADQNVPQHQPATFELAKMVHGGYCIQEDPFPNDFSWQVLDNWRILETSHWMLGWSASIGRYSSTYTIRVNNDSNMLERFLVMVGTGTEPLQQALPYEKLGQLILCRFPPDNLAFARLAFSLQWSFGVWIILQHDLHVNYAVFVALWTAYLSFWILAIFFE